MPTIDRAKVLGQSPAAEKQRQPSPLRRLRSRVASRTVGLLGVAAILCYLYLCAPTRPSYIAGPPYDAAETAALVTEWYELLRDMRYLGSDAIAYPPHVGDRAINVSLATSLTLDPRVVETLLQLPYVVPPGEGPPGGGRGWVGDRDVLWSDGHFMDYRADENLPLALDPLLRGPGAAASWGPWVDFEGLPRSALPLSIIRGQRYGRVLVLDTRSNRIIVLDTQGGRENDDPFFARFERNRIPPEYAIPGLFYGEFLHARLAPDVLRDMISATANLESGYIPGSVRPDSHYTPELSPPQWEGWVRDLYRQSGWPSPDELRRCSYPALGGQPTCNHDDLLSTFRGSRFDEQIVSLRHNITVRYMADWYCPVPRERGFIARLEASGALTDEQLAYAKSDEPVIPIDLQGWGGQMVLLQS